MHSSGDRRARGIPIVLIAALAATAIAAITAAAAFARASRTDSEREKEMDAWADSP